MAASSTEDVFVGLFALAGSAWILWILVRASRAGRLPIRKAEVLRRERPGAFAALFALYGAALLLMAFIGLDLLIGIEGIGR